MTKSLHEEAITNRTVCSCNVTGALHCGRSSLMLCALRIQFTLEKAQPFSIPCPPWVNFTLVYVKHSIG